MQFYFIRHGQSANNFLWDQTGSNAGRSEDAELTEVGRRQAQLVAQFLRRVEASMPLNGHDPHNRAGFALTHLYTSLMVRAVATATAIAEATGLPLIAWQDAHETGGIYLENPETGECIGQPGKSRAYFEMHYPRLVLPERVHWPDGWWNRPQETQEQKPIRAQRFLQELLQRHGAADDRVAVVSHGAFYNYLMMAFLKLPSRDHVWFMLNNTAITRIDFHDEGVGYNGHADLVYTNRTDFLPANMIT